MRLPTNVNSILKNQNYKKYVFVIYNFSNFKIVFELLTKVIVFYINFYNIN